MKSYTDIEQSKKLSEFLSLESADMYYNPRPSNEIPCVGNANMALLQVPCWSLAALLELIPRRIDIGAFKDCIFNFSKAADKKSYIVNYIQYQEYSSFSITVKQIIADNTIDTLFKTVYWLKENNML